MNVEFCEIDCADGETARLRQQAHYWRAQHARAVARETAYKEEVRQLTEIIGCQHSKIAEQTQQIEALKAKLAWLQQQLFGRKSEGTTVPTDKIPGSDQPTNSDPSTPEDQRRRGQQPGAKGHGRKARLELPSEEVYHTLPENKRYCHICQKPFRVFPDTEDSEEIHWEVRLFRRIHKRTRYVADCDCQAVPGILAAPPPPKLIPKGMFSIGFWVHLLLEKFLFQRPLFRICQTLTLEGLRVSQGTLTGGLERIQKLVHPLYTGILERSRAANHWQMDETRWMVFVEIKGKVGYRWWLWVVVTQDTCAYLLEPSRSAEVPKNHLGEDPHGIINADRYSAYKTLGENIRVSFCWSHIRRDFDRIRNGYQQLCSWAENWITRINDLFQRNDQRLQTLLESAEFRREDRALRDAVTSMAELRDRELADPTLHPASRKALKSLKNHWEGAIIFVDHPEIPMDNNESERRLRNPVVGRKNYYGSGAIWSGMLAAAMFTIFQTLLLNHIDPQKFLLAYFEACAENGGQSPKNIAAFLPWNLSEEQKRVWRYPKHPP